MIPWVCIWDWCILATACSSFTFLVWETVIETSFKCAINIDIKMMLLKETVHLPNI